MCDGAEVTKVIDGERVQEDVVLVERGYECVARQWVLLRVVAGLSPASWLVT